MKYLLFIAVLTLSAHAQATTEVFMIIGSKHYNEYKETSQPDSKNGYNEENPGILVQNSTGWLFGAYKNSFYDTTYVLGGYRDFDLISNWIKLRFAYGVTYGYGLDGHKTADADIYGKDIIPFIMPGISIHTNRVWLNAHLAGSAVAYSISYRF